MAKEKKEKQEKIVNELDKCISELNKKHGTGTVRLLEENPDATIPRLSTGFKSLDLILGGGIGEGKLTVLVGKSGSGKTTMALHFLNSALEKYPKKKVGFLDVEMSLNQTYVEALGINSKKLLYMQPPTGEASLDIIEKLALSQKVSMIVLDSIPFLMPSVDMAKGMDEGISMASRARMLSLYMGRILKAANDGKCTLVWINQFRDNLSPYGQRVLEPGGSALKYAACTKLALKIEGKPEVQLGKEGVNIKIEVAKNKLSSPFKSTQLFLQYGSGFSSFLDLITCGIEFDIIKQTGAWYEYQGKKFQGKDDVIKQIGTDPDLYSQLDKDVQKLIK